MQLNIIKGSVTMKSNVHELTKSMDDFRIIPEEAEKTARYNDLDERQSRKLRLLSEELIGMLPELLEYGKGEFWIENDGPMFELHVSVRVENFMNIDRDKVLSVSKSGKNAAAVGIINKIRIATELMMVGYSEVAMYEGCDFYEMGVISNCMEYNRAWSLGNYMEQAKNAHEWDELEKSIIAKLADDVIVGIIGNKVEIVIKKSF